MRMINRELIYVKAFNTYGTKTQRLVAIEEMSELTKELIKNLRGEENIDKIKEEVADVYVMLEQIKLIYGLNNKEIETDMNYKVERLKNRIEEHEW